MAHPIPPLTAYKLERVLAYIEAHLNETIPVPMLAKIGGKMCVSDFRRKFKATAGMSPHQHVTHCRMERAKQLLAETKMSISEIALNVSNYDQSHFGYLFRKHTGTTPQQFRIASHKDKESRQVRVSHLNEIDTLLAQGWRVVSAVVALEKDR